MRFSFAVLCGLLLVVSSFARQKPPEVLIVKLLDTKDLGIASDLPLEVALNSDLDQEGRVIPISWSMADPLFRELVGDRVRPSDIQNPTLAVAMKTARDYKIPYVITVSVLRVEKDFKPICMVYRVPGSNPIWQYGGSKGQDITLSVVKVGVEIDWESTVKSWARTWATQLAAGPFKDFAPHVKLTTSELEPGMTYGGTNPNVLPPLDPKVSERALKLLADGFPAEAISILRDAIDLNPFDPDIRMTLVTVLTKESKLDEAADEALRAVILIPDQAKLRIVAAQSLLRVGRTAEAKSQLNEALARATDDAATDMLLGDMALSQGDAAKAATHYERSLSRTPTYSAGIGMALSMALLGESEDKIRQHLSGIPIAEVSEPGESYRKFVEILNIANEQLGNMLKEALAKGRVKARDPEAIVIIQKAHAVAAGLSMVVAKIECPAIHEKSHQRRVLAQGLLNQAAAEALDFIQSGNADTGDEATLSLGEALKQMIAVRTVFGFELSQP